MGFFDDVEGSEREGFCEPNGVAGEVVDWVRLGLVV